MKLVCFCVSHFGFDLKKQMFSTLKNASEAWWMFDQRTKAVYIINWPTICINQLQRSLSARLSRVFSLSLFTVLYLFCHLDHNQGWKARVRVGNIPIHLSLGPSQSKGCLAEDCGNSCLLISIATLTWEKLGLFYPLSFLTKPDCQWLCQWTLCGCVSFSPLGSDSSTQRK